MMPNYLAMRDRAERTIARAAAGAKFYIRRGGSQTGDVWNPTSSGATDHLVTAVLTEYEQTERDGTVIQQTDKLALVGAKGIAPTTADAFVEEDKETGIKRAHEIRSVNPIRPAGITIIYEVQVRM